MSLEPKGLHSRPLEVANMEDWNQVCFSLVLVGITFFLTILFYEHYRSKKIDDLTKQNENLREEVTFLKKPVDELRKELSNEWQKKIDKITHEMEQQIDKITQEMENQQNHHACELDDLERTHTRELRKKDKNIENLQEKVTTLEEEVSDLEHVRSDLDSLRDEHRALKNELRDLKYESRTLKKKVEEYEDLIYTREKLTGIVRDSRYPRGSTYDPQKKAKALYDLKQSGLSYGEIAKKTGIKKGTVKGTIARHKKTLAPPPATEPNADETTSETSEDSDHEAHEH